ncbi:MAG: FHA domain-containing protein [Acidobacteria bacterium]|nr:MAG: FHA domain-containing protein [Acidobacteriota bacterium]MCE7956941.1 FHA domain-containing protein [Acidobacteria bacterium ACB2]
MDARTTPAHGSQPLLSLHVVPADGPPFDHPLVEDSLVIGRSSTCGLALPDRFLSRQHSRIYREGDRVLIEDLGSRNGTLLNGQRLTEPRPLKAGDVVKVSGSVLTVHSGSARPLSAAPPDSGRQTLFRSASELLDSASGPLPLLAAPSLARYAERLKLLHEVHLALGRPIGLEDLLELILDRAFDHLRPERAAIYLRTPQGELLQAASRSAAGEADVFAASQHLVAEVIDKGLAALVTDAQTDARFADAQSLLSSGVRSLIAAPLLTPDGPLGMIALDSKANVRLFGEEDLELLVGLAAVAALRIRNVALVAEAAERKRLEEELALARRIQVALLPARIPGIPGWELHGGNVPSRGVSGDYYQVVERSEGREGVVFVADVSGKGVAASLLTASLEALAAGPIEDGEAPDAIFLKLSRQLFRRTPPEKYATAFVGVLESGGGKVRYASAGHNPPLVVRAGGAVERLGPTGPPLGLLPVATYGAGEVLLDEGDLLAVYTDGIVEATDPDGEEYGVDRLARACEAAGSTPLPDLARRLEEDLTAFARGVPFADDRTIVLARRRS